MLFLVLSGPGFGAGLLARSDGREITVGVEGMDATALAALGDGTRLRFVYAPDEPTRATALADASLAGVLTRHADGSFTLSIGMASGVVLRDPDTTLGRGLAIFPLTSAPALPIRASLSDVGALETIVAVVLLVATIWLTRRAAGRIFEIGILMYGKEPSFAEMVRWARRA